MGFLDKEVKSSVQAELSAEERMAQEEYRRQIEAFNDEGNIQSLVDKTALLVREAFKAGKVPISSIRIDMSLAHTTYNFNGNVAANQLCIDALSAALRAAEPNTDEVDLVWHTREVDYSTYLTDKWITVSFEPPLA